MPQTADPPKLARVRGLVAFTAGSRNGDDYGPADIQELVDNYHRVQAADPGTGRPFWLPYFSINHEEGKYAGLSVGDVTGLRAGTSDDGRPALIADGDRVPPDVKADLDAGRLRAVSVEWFDSDGPFVGPDDVPVDGKVLKCISLLGAMSEASKGMPAPVATFADRARVRRFTSEATPTMDRDQMIAALAAMNVDTSLITEAVPDALLAGVIAAVQAAQAPPPEPPPVEPPAAGFGDDKMPAAMAAKFKDLDRQAKQIAAQNAALLRAQADQLKAAKADKVKRFCDDLAAAGQLAPAARPAIEAMLTDCDAVRVRKFADDKTAGTVLDERMAQLRAALPRVRTFGDKVPDPAPGDWAGVLDRMRARIASTRTPAAAK